ncbi:acyltransferase [Variovorax sp. J22G21]|uniref:acyltransferase n=1 Tax=Variovorax fucosicus TaxID=3053517 RepID=UPI0025753702|nr:MULTISPECIES: acyltransferase [unclassified Variovorax]MDM0037777.1 acyltransferase [Variovorax sp. J22R193]MDM0056554.1 acyltransferase [Variovorax sp. J22G47]MDM0062553.1 acyltransferase [Variovorax sp. J22G21]
MRKLLSLAVVLLPWPLKRWLLRRVWGYRIADDARIGLSYIFPGQLEMGSGARIGHFNVAIHLGRLECGEHSIIERGNWITGHAPDGAHFTHRTARDPALLLGAHAAITKSHIIDCTDRVEIGAFSTVAGYHSQIITHGIDIVAGRQDCKPISIGAYCLVGTRVTVLGGAVLPDRCVLGAGAVLNKPYLEEHALYAGQPAVRVKALPADAAYFHRAEGFVD